MGKLVVCIADGMGDLADRCPEGHTPLDVARTPALDSMARHGVAGLCHVIPDGMSPDSDVGNMALMGYEPEKYHTGRGPVEALACGVAAAPDDLIWRVSLATATGFTASDRLTNVGVTELTDESGAALIEVLQQSLGTSSFSFYANEAYRHILVQHGGGLAGQKALIKGPHQLLNISLGEALRPYTPQMRTMIEKSYSLLAPCGEKANIAWLWGQGPPLSLPPFFEVYGSKACIVSGISLMRGLALAAEIENMSKPEFTGLPDSDLTGKGVAAASFLRQGGDIAFIHVEAPDYCGHQGDFEGKKKAIERIDAELVPIVQRLVPEAAWLVTCDHFTPVTTRAHHAGPVPFIISHPQLSQSCVPRITEWHCRRGKIVSSGVELLQMAMRIADSL